MIELNFDNLHRWPFHIKAIILLLCAIVVAMLSYQMFVRERVQQLQQLERTHVAIKQKMIEQQRKLEEIALDASEVLAGNNSSDEADWLDIISTAISLSGLALLEINRSDALLNIAALGDYQALVALLRRLPCCIAIEKWQVALLSKSTLQINIEMIPYHLVENFSKENKQYTDNKFYDPFLLKNQKTELRRWPLAEHSIEQIYLKGSLLQVNKRWGFLGTADDDLYCVTANDIIGKEEAQIVALDNDSITLDYAVFDAYGRAQHKITTLSLVESHD